MRGTKWVSMVENESPYATPVNALVSLCKNPLLLWSYHLPPSLPLFGLLQTLHMDDWNLGTLFCFIDCIISWELWKQHGLTGAILLFSRPLFPILDLQLVLVQISNSRTALPRALLACCIQRVSTPNFIGFVPLSLNTWLLGSNSWLYRIRVVSTWFNLFWFFISGWSICFLGRQHFEILGAQGTRLWLVRSFHFHTFSQVVLFAHLLQQFPSCIYSVPYPSSQQENIACVKCYIYLLYSK